MTGRVFLASIWARWTVLAHAIGNFQARLILSVLYFVLIPPFGLLVRGLMDPLDLRQRPRATFWRVLTPRSAVLTDAHRQS